MCISNCPTCWETPCICGESFRHLSTNELMALVVALNKLVADRVQAGFDPTVRRRI